MGMGSVSDTDIVKCGSVDKSPCGGYLKKTGHGDNMC